MLSGRAMRDHLRGQHALVTGASSGLGADFARELGRRGCHLVLVARRKDRLLRLASSIEEECGVRVRVIALDLGAPAAPEELHRRVAELGVEVDVLVNNAGFGIFGEFLDIPWERERAMLDLDVRTVVHLTKLFARDMVARESGYVLQVGSIGAYQPSPSYASYAAAKAFVLAFGEALSYELRGSGVSCTVVSPGVTATEFLEVSGQRPTPYQRWVMMESPEVARKAVRAMLRRKPSFVPGLANKLSAFSIRLLPRRWSAALAHYLMREPERAALPSPRASG